MPSGKEIRTKIKSVENTRKITKAMEMVAASKMRKAQERMLKARPYGEKIRRVAEHLSHALSEYRHPFLEKRDQVKKVGIILVTSDKGLCGGLNTNVLRQLVNKMRELDGQKVQVQVTAIGSKGFAFLQRNGAEIASQVTGLGDNPHIDSLIGPVKVQIDAFNAGEIDDLLVRDLEALVYQSVAENIASEQSARMVAMKAASDNAKNVIEELKLVYNKTRQAAITKELSEIVSGAAAV